MFQFQKIINLNIKCLHLAKQVDYPTLSAYPVHMIYTANAVYNRLPTQFMK